MSWQTIDGIRVYFRLSGDPGGTPLVLLHGLQGDSSHFETLAPTLARHYRVLVFDQRGSGWSDKPAGEYTTDLLADDAVALMDRLALERADVFGVSMGGMIAQELALRHPDRIHALILGCTSARGADGTSVNRGTEESAYDLVPISAEERARRLAATGLSAAFLEAHPEVVETLIEARRRRPLDIDALTRRHQAVQQHDTLARLDRIRAPTLVVTGLEDMIVPPASSRLLAERIPGARLETLDGAGHLFWMEQPARTARLAREFIAAHRPGH